MSWPESDFSAVEPLLNQSARTDEFANLFPDTAGQFEDWLETLKPADRSSRQLTSVSDPSDSNYQPEKSREISFEGTLRVDGYVAGDVHSSNGTLMTSEAAEIDGDVSVDAALIRGLVRGDIKAATRVVLASTARVIGDIETPALSIEPGAVFEGHCSFLRLAEKPTEPEPPRAALAASAR